MKDRYYKNKFKPYKQYGEQNFQKHSDSECVDKQQDEEVENIETNDKAVESNCEVEENIEQCENLENEKVEQNEQANEEAKNFDEEINIDEEHQEESKLQNENQEADKDVSDAYFKQLLSLQAEFDNYRKRTQADVSKAYQNGFNEAITEFLPALDSFKMATDMITDKNTLMGIQYIEKGILSVLEKMGITVIDTSGEFDPNLHQAIGTDSEADVESGHIVKECFKGFKMGDKVIRYAQVIVKK